MTMLYELNIIFKVDNFLTYRNTITVFDETFIFILLLLFKPRLSHVKHLQLVPVVGLSSHCSLHRVAAVRFNSNSCFVKKVFLQYSLKKQMPMIFMKGLKAIFEIKQVQLPVLIFWSFKKKVRRLSLLRQHHVDHVLWSITLLKQYRGLNRNSSS